MQYTVLGSLWRTHALQHCAQVSPSPGQKPVSYHRAIPAGTARTGVSVAHGCGPPLYQMRSFSSNIIIIVLHVVKT